MRPELRVRDARVQDAPAVAAIYAHAVLHETGTFEEVPPDAVEIARRMGEVQAQGCPYVVVEAAAGRVLAFGYAVPFRPRSAYRFTAETSVYVAHDAKGQGCGRAVLEALVERSRERGATEMLAVIGDSQNQASIALHRALGFQVTGGFQRVGFKFGRWLDVVFMQRSLG